MRIICGAVASGKRTMARALGLTPLPATLETLFTVPCVYDFEHCLRQLLDQDTPLETLISSLIAQNPGITILCGDIGMGIVPLDPKERQWRELCGKALCLLCRQADTVIRMVCGIPVYIKGDQKA